MQRVRRLGSLALVVVLGAVGLTGCRSAPTVAAYVGDKEYSQRYVNDMTDELNATLASIQGDQDDPSLTANIRQSAIEVIVVGEIARRVAADRKIRVPAADIAYAADAMQIAPGTPGVALLKTEYAKVLADKEVAVAALLAATPAAEPTEADQRAVFKSLSSQGRPVSDSFEDALPFLNKDSIGHHLALRDWLTEGMDRYDVTVNPRYAPVATYIVVPFNSLTGGYLTIPLVTR